MITRSNEIGLHRSKRRAACRNLIGVLLVAGLLAAIAGQAAAGPGRTTLANNPVWVQRAIPGPVSAVADVEVGAGKPQQVSVVLEASNILYSSQSGGVSWTQRISSSGLPFERLSSSRAGIQDYAIDAASTVYRSGNGGATWDTLPLMGVPVSDLDTCSENAVLAAATGTPGTDLPPYFSMDSGVSWTPSAGPSAVWSLMTGDPTTWRTFYAVQQGVLAAPVFKSADGGTTWNPSGALPDPSSVTAVAVFPGGGPVLVGTDTPGVGPVYRSDDGGTSWVEANTGLPVGERVLDIAVTGASPAVAYVATDTGVFASYDQGTTWCDVSGDLPAKEYRCVAASGGAGGSIFAGAADGTLYSCSPPLITGITPDTGYIGDTVDISGMSFGAPGAGSYVSFAGIPATSYAAWTDSLITAVVPEGVTSGGVFVVTPLGTSNSMEFTIETPVPPTYTWYLAEGSTGAEARGDFETWVLVQNPDGASASVTVTYMTVAGPKNGPVLSVPPDSRITVNVADWVPDTWSVSTMVTSDRPVIVERAVYWNTPSCYRQAATDSIGVTSTAADWYLAEGCTGESSLGIFETWVLVMNPGTEAASVQITYMTPSGAVTGPTLMLGPGSRHSVDVSDTLPNCWSVSTHVHSSKPVVAERSMYINTPSVFRQAAHDSIGVQAGNATWYLAEGCAGANGLGSFETWVLVQNPADSAAQVRLTYMTPEGMVNGPDLTLEARTRRTVNVADTVPGIWEVSTLVAADRPVIAERAIYWTGKQGFRQAATDSVGVTTPATTWYLAEGCTGSNGQGAFETWVLVQNPGSVSATASLTFMTSRGPVEGPTIVLQPNSRKTVNAADTVPGCWDVSTQVTSNYPVIVERAVYWNSSSMPRQAAHDSIGVP